MQQDQGAVVSSSKLKMATNLTRSLFLPSMAASIVDTFTIATAIASPEGYANGSGPWPLLLAYFATGYSNQEKQN